MLSFLFPFPTERIPLIKIKSMRENLRRKDLLKDYLEKHPYRLFYKFYKQSNSEATYEPMRNYLDVSVVGGGGCGVPHNTP